MLNPISDISHESEQRLSLVNKLSEPIFNIKDNVEQKEFKLNLGHDLISPEIQFKINELFVELCGGWSVQSIQSLDSRGGTANSYKYSLIRLGVWWSCNLPNLPMSQWTEIEVKKLLVAAISGDINWSQKVTVIPTSRGTIENLYLILSRSRDFKLQGKLLDGLSFDLPKNFLEECVGDYLKGLDIPYHVWLKGGTWESIPLPVAMALLSDAINVIRDEKTLFLVDYFDLMRTDDTISPRTIFNRNGYQNFLEKKQTRKNQASKKYLKLKKLILKNITGSSGDLPFDNHIKLTDYCDEVYDSCIVIFLCLTGIRISELASISTDNYSKKTDGTWTFKSKLIKTGFGIPDLREMSGLVADAADILSSLSYIEKQDRADGQKLMIFGRYFFKRDFNNEENFRKTNRSISKGTLSNRLKNHYVKFLKKHPEFEQLCNSIHPHRFRNTWAEFAIRRFDGNVLEGIRAHFRHAFGSRYTKHYVFDKLSPEVKELLEKEYLKEVIEAMALQGLEVLSDPLFKKDLIGNVVNYISQAMKVNVITIEELDDFVNEISEEFERIVAHEYGYCIVRKATKSQSACMDKETQTPKFQDGCFELCSGCVNFLTSQKSNKESITRIAVSHNNMIEDFQNIFGTEVKSRAIESSLGVVKKADKILKGME